MARRPDEIQAPNGFPLRLYVLKTPKAQKLVVASSREIAVSKIGLKPNNKKKAKPVNVGELISANGHTKTAQILKTLGPNWICKEGKIFYKTVTRNELAYKS